eukprot:jgi/Galph1/3864/GphlegSOOS_G2552.1
MKNCVSSHNDKLLNSSCFNYSYCRWNQLSTRTRAIFFHAKKKMAIKGGPIKGSFLCCTTAVLSIRNHARKVPQDAEIIENYRKASKVPHDGLSFLQRAQHYVTDKMIVPSCATILVEWYHSYLEAVKECPRLAMDPLFFTENMFQVLLELVRQACQVKYLFEPFHQSLRVPFDYLSFGLDFARPIVNIEDSIMIGEEYFSLIETQIERGDNVVLFSNHQSEGDPHAVHVLLDERLDKGSLGEKMIFMAGDRVRDDPVAVPFSLGRNLLTVYSKRHINDIPETRAEKLLHNRKTITKMQQMLEQGGNIIWFAPSGGRDRRDSMSKRVEVAPFVADSLELMRFVANQAQVPAHFYPLALATYNLLPPPDHIQTTLGEKRLVRYVPIGMALGEPLDWDHVEQQIKLPSHTTENIVQHKEMVREKRCLILYEMVKNLYEQVCGFRQ